jgi:HAD superfamily hydrolase (TIGR01450 family)
MATPAFDLGRYAAAVFDLDGTVWLSEEPVQGAIAFVDRCRDLGLTITFATNATAFSVAALTELLIDCGLGREGDAVVTGGSVVARSLATFGVREVVAEVPPAMRAAIAGEGATVTTLAGVEIPEQWLTTSPERAVVLGASRAATFGSVERIGHLASLGHPLFVTSLDPGYPALGRLEPGGGMLVAALHALYDGIDPIVLGKPSPQYAAVVRDSVRTDGPIVMFGDSQRADMGIAEHLGADGVLIAPAGRVSAALVRPHFVTAGLHDGIRPYQEHRP